MTSFRSVSILIAAAVLLSPTIAAAQNQTAAPQQPQAPPAPPPIQAGFNDGFFVQSANGDNRLVFGMVAQVDGRFSLDDPKPIINTFTLRKLRPTFTGQLSKYFTFKFMPDLGNGTTSVQDAYFDTRFSPKLRLRLGKDKTPVGYELLQGDAYLWFPERAQASNLVPNRDNSVQLQGDLSPKIFYTAGLYNGVPDGSSSTTEVDTNSAKDFAGRIVVQPFRTATSSNNALSGLGFHLGGSHGDQNGTLPSFRTSVGQVYYTYATGAAADGVRNRVSPAVFYYHHSFGSFAEYMFSSQKVTRNGVSADVDNHAWEVTGSYFLTGETASYGIIRPRNAFDPPNHHWGALQVLARVTALAVDQAAFDAGLAAATASREAHSFTLATNWYPTTQIKIYATFERTTFSGGADRPAENVILYRAQVAF
jgi:phosphate-selective porin OprO/OprP